MCQAGDTKAGLWCNSPSLHWTMTMLRLHLVCQTSSFVVKGVWRYSAVNDYVSAEAQSLKVASQLSPAHTDLFQSLAVHWQLQRSVQAQHV